MTGDEAKTKWCPFARVGSSAVAWPSANRDVVPDAGPRSMERLSRCIASACMAWRGRVMTSMGSGEDYDEGYCGLAGKPE